MFIHSNCCGVFGSHLKNCSSFPFPCLILCSLHIFLEIVIHKVHRQTNVLVCWTLHLFHLEALDQNLLHHDTPTDLTIKLILISTPYFSISSSIATATFLPLRASWPPGNFWRAIKMSIRIPLTSVSIYYAINYIFTTTNCAPFCSAQRKTMCVTLRSTRVCVCVCGEERSAKMIPYWLRLRTYWKFIRRILGTLFLLRVLGGIPIRLGTVK